MKDYGMNYWMLEDNQDDGSLISWNDDSSDIKKHILEYTAGLKT